MHNFRPAVKSGLWQVREPRGRVPLSALALTLAHSYSVSHLGVSTQALFPWAKQIHSTYGSLQKVCSSVYSIRLTQGGFDSHVCEALSWVPRQGMPGWMESTGAAKPGLGGREAPKCSLWITAGWASSAGQPLKPNALLHQKESLWPYTYPRAWSICKQSICHSMEAYHQATNSAFLHWENKFYLLTCYQQQ